MNRTSGTLGFDTAKLCFEENLKFLGNAANDPEKFNLYNGLKQFVIGLEQMKDELVTLRKEVAELKSGR